MSKTGANFEIGLGLKSLGERVVVAAAEIGDASSHLNDTSRRYQG
jgi:hypothetical protein